MNLKEFISYRYECPLCSCPLTLTFHSKKWQNLKYEGNRLNVMFRMDALKRKQKDYKVTYSFGMEDNSWYVDFFSKDEKLIEIETQTFLMDRFKELNKNLKKYIFYKHCGSCNCYVYSSNGFELDFKAANIGDIQIVNEYFGMFSQLEKGCWIYKLQNNYKSGQSTLMHGKSSSEIYAQADCGIGSHEVIQTSLIKFSNKDETLDRIKKLLLFS